MIGDEIKGNLRIFSDFQESDFVRYVTIHIKKLYAVLHSSI